MSHAPNTNYFELYGLVPRFEIDLVELEHSWRTLQSEFHPDRFSAENSPAQMEALKQSSLINEGYRVLRQDASRGRHLLALLGVNPDTSGQPPLEFLMGQMAWHESVEQAISSASLSQLEALLGELKQTMNSLTTTLVRLLDQQKNYSQAAVRLQEFGFYLRLQETIENALEVLDYS